MAPPAVAGEAASTLAHPTPATRARKVEGSGSDTHESLIISDGTVQRVHGAAEVPSSPLPLLGVGKNINLKKGAMWGAQDAGTKNPTPPLTIVGSAFNGDATTPRPPSMCSKTSPSAGGGNLVLNSSDNLASFL